jgi:hypothetical protein
MNISHRFDPDWIWSSGCVHKTLQFSENHKKFQFTENVVPQIFLCFCFGDALPTPMPAKHFLLPGLPTRPDSPGLRTSLVWSTPYYVVRASMKCSWICCFNRLINAGLLIVCKRTNGRWYKPGLHWSCALNVVCAYDRIQCFRKVHDQKFNTVASYWLYSADALEGNEEVPADGGQDRNTAEDTEERPNSDYCTIE